MNDPCLRLLCAKLAELHGKTLWLADEIHLEALPHLAPYSSSIDFHTNRFDVHQQALSAGLESQFSDWVLGAERKYTNVVLRIGKEKAVGQHLIKSASSLLLANGRLLLAGQKNEGIKSYAKIASEIFTGNPKGKHLNKHGNCYYAEFINNEHTVDADKDYHQIKQVAEWQGIAFHSKPGVYGWNKIDAGSALLVERLTELIQNDMPKVNSILDIGCGYGFLCVASAFIKCEKRVATDNNAAALECCAFNAKHHDFPLEVVAGDCANTVDGNFDLVLCNPPFHKGFDVDGELTTRFLQAARDKLNKNGIAIFVVNSFIPIEKKLTHYFKTYETLANTGQFKVLKLIA